jgi:hypothetical protein
VAKIVSASAEDDLRRSFAKSFQSGHINFLIGSGASLPAIPAAGAVEQEIASLMGKDLKAGRKRMSEFLSSIQEPTNRLIESKFDGATTASLEQYKDFLAAVEEILLRRRTTLLPRQVAVFSTNYDLLVEQASVSFASLTLNDGFARVRSLSNRMEFSSRNFFNTTYSTGNLYGYRAENPCINLIKVHGSLSWRKDKDDILFDVATKASPAANASAEEIEQFVDAYAVVLPQAAKFHTTLLDRTYYDLLRIFANELDRENALLVVFGFSFGDEHIRDIAVRALKNPTLRIVIVAYDQVATQRFSQTFAKHGNVEIVAPDVGAQVDFKKFNSILRSVLSAPGAS